MLALSLIHPIVLLIGRDTATYWLHILGYKLTCPKHGIYKDAHERPDVVQYRKVYTVILRGFKERERTYTGDRLDNLVLRSDTTRSDIIRIYHDECIYASSEGALSLWVPDGTDPLFKKPRGHIVMCSGFICSCHGLMRIASEEERDFLEWRGRVKKSFPCHPRYTPRAMCIAHALRWKGICCAPLPL